MLLQALPLLKLVVASIEALRFPEVQFKDLKRLDLERLTCRCHPIEECLLTRDMLIECPGSESVMTNSADLRGTSSVDVDFAHVLKPLDVILQIRLGVGLRDCRGVLGDASVETEEVVTDLHHVHPAESPVMVHSVIAELDRRELDLHFLVTGPRGHREVQLDGGGLPVEDVRDAVVDRLDVYGGEQSGPVLG